MASHEQKSKSDEWWTPQWVFTALGVYFDLDPCSPENCEWSLSHAHYTKKDDGLQQEWEGSVWLNPPYGGRNGIRPWMNRLVRHGNGIALVPNRTGADWWQDYAERADGMLFVRGKIKFVRPDGSEGKSPGYGNVLMAYGNEMANVLRSSAIRGVRT